MDCDIYKYGGAELTLFAQALHWKTYVASLCKPWIRGRVLEIGAGIGSNIPYLFTEEVTEWVAVEPDSQLVQHIPQQVRSKTVLRHNGTLDDLPDDRRYDTLVYIDVLEHIEEDASELNRAKLFLNKGGRIVILSPAHQRLFSPFDKEVGHYRRYSKNDFRRLAQDSLHIESLKYVDSLGYFCSLANRTVLGQSSAKLSQIRFWDNWLVPCSTVLDKVLGYAFGKSIFVVYSLKEQ